MAIYLDICNLIISKQIVREKYIGGINQFRMDYDLPNSEINQEDDELFALGQMNVDEFDIEKLVSNGLRFDFENQQSTDFFILERYGDFIWNTDCIEHNRVFAWHKETSKAILSRVNEISNMSIEEIFEQLEKGNNLLQTIKKLD